MGAWLKPLLFMGGGAFAIFISTQMDDRKAGYAFVLLAGIAVFVIGVRFALRAAVFRQHQSAVSTVASNQPAATSRPSPSGQQPAPQSPAHRVEQINARFADATATFSFNVSDMLSALGATRGDLFPYVAKYTGTAETGFTTSWQSLARQVASNVPLAAAQNAVVSEMPNFTVQRTVFRMSEQEKEIARIMALLNVNGAVDGTFFRNFEWGIIFGGGAATIMPTGRQTEYTEVAKAAITDLLTDQLSSPNELIDAALSRLHEIKQRFAQQRPGAASPGQQPPTQQQIRAVRSVLDDL